MKTKDPIENAVPQALRKSNAENTLAATSGFVDGVDGDYMGEEPVLAEPVGNRLATLRCSADIQIPSIFTNLTFKSGATKSTPISGSGKPGLYTAANGKY
jgi:hypothetical protein